MTVCLGILGQMLLWPELSRPVHLPSLFKPPPPTVPRSAGLFTRVAFWGQFKRHQSRLYSRRRRSFVRRWIITWRAQLSLRTVQSIGRPVSTPAGPVYLAMGGQLYTVLSYFYYSLWQRWVIGSAPLGMLLSILELQIAALYVIVIDRYTRRKFGRFWFGDLGWFFPVISDLGHHRKFAATLLYVSAFKLHCCRTSRDASICIRARDAEFSFFCGTPIPTPG